MKKLQLLGIFLTLTCLSYAQKENNFWAWGNGVGLDFSSGTAVPVKTGIHSVRGSAAVSDPKTGSLLFYSEGDTVWNKNHQHMTNGTGLEGNKDWEKFNNSTQGVCIIPFINDPKKFYLFSLEVGSAAPFSQSSGRLFYSVVDMSRNGGLGDVDPIRKNILLDSFIADCLIAIPGNSCNDVWLVANVADTGLIKAYHITASGVDATPVISYIGKDIDGKGAFKQSQFAVSPDRTKLAMNSYNVMFYAVPISFFHPNSSPNGAQICDFDPWTGKVSNPIVLNSSLKSPGSEKLNYGICFSPDGSKLYMSYGNRAPGDLNFVDSLWQYDLSIYTDAAITASKTYIRSSLINDKFSVFQKRDDKIYVTSPESTKALDIINKPNLKGSACDYQANAIPLLAGMALTYSMPVEVPVLLRMDTIYTLATDSLVCSGWESGIPLTAPVSQDALSYRYQWSNGDTTQKVAVNSRGTYWVKYYNSCHYHVDTIVLRGSDIDAVININEFELGTTIAYKSYQWLLDGKIIQGATGAKYNVGANGDYSVVVTDELGCTDTSAILKITNYTSIDPVTSLARQINIYPNPARDIVHIHAPFEINVLLTTMEGRVIHRSNGGGSISVKGLATGIYLLQVTDSKGIVLRVEKIIKSI